jgi:3,4-dihydroxy 2-butanone 4-phosphate synthase / GTP cyclohydrolase II
MFDTIEAALEELKKGHPIIVVDDEDRENEGDFIVPAQFASTQVVNFLINEGRGLICATLEEPLAKKLALHPMVETNSSAHHTAFTVSIDHLGAGTGISAMARSHTLTQLALSETCADDFVRPGHIFPLVAKSGGTLVRAGHTEASIDLMKMAGLVPVGVICEILNPNGEMARRDDLRLLAQEKKIKMISIEEIIKYRKRNENWVQLSATTPLPTKWGEDFKISIFENKYNQDEHHTVITKGDLSKAEKVPLRIHSACMTGDIFGSLKCDCGEQLNKFLKIMSEKENGILIYLHQEGRGIGLREKIKAYALQENGRSTVEANTDLGHPVDARDFSFSLKVLEFYGIASVDLYTNNPDKMKIFEGEKILVNRFIHDSIVPNLHNSHYLYTKKNELRHHLEIIENK